MTAVGLNTADDAAAARAFVERHGWEWPQLLDPERELARSLGAEYQPHVLLLDEQGRVVAEHEGGGTAEDWEELLAALG